MTERFLTQSSILRQVLTEASRTAKLEVVVKTKKMLRTGLEHEDDLQ